MQQKTSVREKDKKKINRGAIKIAAIKKSSRMLFLMKLTIEGSVDQF